MNREYHWIFDEMYRRYARYDPDFPFPHGVLLSRLRFEIDSSTEKADMVRNLRADAKVFLLINLYEMYVRPVALRGFFSRGETIEEVFVNLSSDLETILGQARLDSNAENANETTARHILSAINSVYGRLKISSFNVWG
jgi:hypothetical protein